VVPVSLSGQHERELNANLI